MSKWRWVAMYVGGMLYFIFLLLVIYAHIDRDATLVRATCKNELEEGE